MPWRQLKARNSISKGLLERHVPPVEVLLHRATPAFEALETRVCTGHQVCRREGSVLLCDRGTAHKKPMGCLRPTLAVVVVVVVVQQLLLLAVVVVVLLVVVLLLLLVGAVLTLLMLYHSCHHKRL